MSLAEKEAVLDEIHELSEGIAYSAGYLLDVTAQLANAAPPEKEDLNRQFQVLEAQKNRLQAKVADCIERLNELEEQDTQSEGYIDRSYRVISRPYCTNFPVVRKPVEPSIEHRCDKPVYYDNCYQLLEQLPRAGEKRTTYTKLKSWAREKAARPKNFIRKTWHKVRRRQ